MAEQRDRRPGGAVTYVDTTTQQATDITGVSTILNWNGALYYVVSDSDTDTADLDTYDLQTVPQTVYSFNASVSSPEIESPTEAGSDLFFTALVKSGTERQLWVTNGTSAGTIQLTSSDSSGEGADPTNLTDVAGTLYFTAIGANNQNQLWQSVGTIQGTSLVTDLTTAPQTGFELLRSRLRFELVDDHGPRAGGSRGDVVLRQRRSRSWHGALVDVGRPASRPGR